MLDFDFDIAGPSVDRKALLLEAADRLDALQTHLGPGTKEAAIRSVGDLARGLIDDQAEFTAAPEVYKITEDDFERQHRQAPVLFKQMAADYDFYWLRFPIFLNPQGSCAFNR